MPYDQRNSRRVMVNLRLSEVEMNVVDRMSEAFYGNNRSELLRHALDLLLDYHKIAGTPRFGKGE